MIYLIFLLNASQMGSVFFIFIYLFIYCFWLQFRNTWEKGLFVFGGKMGIKFLFSHFFWGGGGGGGGVRLQFRDVWEKGLFVFGGKMGQGKWELKKTPNITVFEVPWWAWSPCLSQSLPPIIYHSSSLSFFLTYQLNL